jgi:hypothetical protein
LLLLTVICTRLSKNYFITALPGAKRSQLIMKYIAAINSTGCKVRAVVMDAHPSNVSAYTHLGCIFQLDKLKTDFMVDGEPVFAFFDACHALKLLRNLMGDFDLKDGDGGLIQFQYLEKLVELQKQHGLHLGHKLTPRHIKYANEKMKTKLAGQALSR